MRIFDLDRLKEILSTITRNKSRSLLTGFGVFWGVFMLVALIGGGGGLKQMLQKNFEGFATNSAMVWANSTTKAYKGLPKGRSWQMRYKDVQRLRNRIPELDIVTPVVFGGFGETTLVYGDRKQSCNARGVLPEYAEVEQPKLAYGRFINQVDIEQSRKVCVIGKRLYETLFSRGEDPCGRFVRLDSVYYQVVGVDVSNSSININGSAQDRVTIPLSLMQKTLNRGDKIDVIAMTAREGVTMSSLTDRMRETIARQHNIDPDDEQAVMMFNSEQIFRILDNLFRGVNFLIWLVGIGTLLAGAIGVSNIMMVTVKERTVEIGIRRAIGATPRMILSQIIQESVILTLAAGLSGVLFAVAVLQMLELGLTDNGTPAATFQVGFGTAISAALLVALLGVAAGLAPALRAMSIKPVDAMRDE